MAIAYPCFFSSHVHRSAMGLVSYGHGYQQGKWLCGSGFNRLEFSPSHFSNFTHIYVFRNFLITIREILVEIRTKSIHDICCLLFGRRFYDWKCWNIFPKFSSFIWWIWSDGWLRGRNLLHASYISSYEMVSRS